MISPSESDSHNRVFQQHQNLGDLIKQRSAGHISNEEFTTLADQHGPQLDLRAMGAILLKRDLKNSVQELVDTSRHMVHGILDILRRV